MRVATVLKRGSFVGAAGLTVAVALATSWATPQSEGEGEYIELMGVVRDFRPMPDLHPDFDNPQLNGPYGCYVMTQLDADFKPKYSVGTGKRIQQEWRDAETNKICWCLTPQMGDDPGDFGGNSTGAVTSADTFAQWFRDVPGVNLSTEYTMQLTMETGGEYAGAYSYETNDFHPFYPIDGQLYGNGSDQHNWFFTYEVVAYFTYDASANQFVKFKGDDDAWLFINGKLVMDHGGIVGSREYYVDMDRLGLTNGETYDFRFFHAERKQPMSQFHLWTNIALEQSDPNVVSVSAAYD